jgi:hypothetical protein
MAHRRLGVASRQRTLDGSCQRIRPRLVHAGGTPGMRSDGFQNHRLLYEAQDFYLDLQSEVIGDSLTGILVGQLANWRDPAQEASDIPVLLLKGSRVVARAVTNSFGEFEVEYTMSDELRLNLLLDHRGTCIDLSLWQLLLRMRGLRSTRVPRAMRPVERGR